MAEGEAWWPRLRTVLAGVNVLILALPLGGIATLRLYENELLRRAESELLAQGAFVRSAYEEALVEGLGAEVASYGRPAEVLELGVERGDGLTPIVPRLDLAQDEVRGAAAPPQPAPGGPEPHAAAAGERVQPILVAAQRTTLAGVRVVDPGGVVVASTRGELGMSLAHREEIRRALRGERVALMRERISDEPSPPLESLSRGTRVRVFVALPVVVEGRVLGAVALSRTPLDVSKGLWLMRWELGVMLGAVALVSLGVSLLVSWTITRPVRALVEQTRRVARGEPPGRLARVGTWEVAQLAAAFDVTWKAQAERAAYIQTFASNVSHEFKTPLASLRGTTELLRDHFDTMSEDERERFLGMVEADTARLGRLVDRLTELARADVVRPGEEVCEGVGVAREVAARFGLEAPEVAAGAEEAAVRMGRSALDSTLGNLVDNARQHAGAGARVWLTVERGAGDAVVFTVADDGVGISEANQRRVFERFFTTARERGGSGLGLAIVASLAAAHGGAVALESALGEGTRVRLTLPRAPRRAGGAAR